jgi:hypothetical protein
MTDPKMGLWLLPTRHRIEKLRAFLTRARETGLSTEIVLLVQEDEFNELADEYNAIRAEFRVGLYQTHGEGMAIKCQEYYEFATGEGVNQDYFQWLGILADDLIPHTPGWDIELISRLNGWNFVSPDDLWQSPNRIGGGGIAFSGDLLRAIGYFAPPGLRHLYWDDVLETIGRDMGVWHYVPKVVIEHKHAALEVKPIADPIGSTIDSTTAKIGTFWDGDETVYRTWRRVERKATSKRIAELMRSKGVPMLNTDLSHVRLLITSPCSGAEFYSEFMNSLLNTYILLTELGAHVDFHKLPGCSDIVFGRSTLFSGFINSDFTHNLQIDSDMEWKPMDVVRMLCAMRDKKLPFLAVAGPRKTDGEMVFATTNADDLGHVRPSLVHGDGLIENSEVGGAFVLVDRTFADRMTAAYPELRAQDGNGKLHYFFWLPTVKDLRYRGEDYAMCRRWREIGGKVTIMPEIVLGHSGIKTWRGCFSEQINREREKLAQAEQPPQAEAAQ